MVKLCSSTVVQCLLTVVSAGLIGSGFSLGLYDPCTTPGLATKVRDVVQLIADPSLCRLHANPWVYLQGKGIYMGMAFWPGGTIADWGVISETVANATAPLYPCTTTNNWNTTGLSDQAYLVCVRAAVPLS